MVEIDSSESSSDEEDRRLKPIRRHDGPGFASRTRVFDAAQQPEGSAPPEFFLGLDEEQDMNQLVAAYQKQNISELTFRGNFSELGCSERQIEQNLSKELISLSRKLEKFSLKMKQIPPQSLAARNLHVGLQLVKEYLSNANENLKFNKNINSCELNGYSDSLQNTEPYDEWFSPVGFKEQSRPTLECDIMLKKSPNCNDALTKKNASSQTNLSGDVIPREASAALEFFQELIKKG